MHRGPGCEQPSVWKHADCWFVWVDGMIIAKIFLCYISRETALFRQAYNLTNKYGCTLLRLGRVAVSKTMGWG